MNEEEPEYGPLKPEPQECSVCFEEVYPDAVVKEGRDKGAADCITCKNGHFLHRKCYQDMPNNLCPKCRQPMRYNCKGALGYIQLKRKGGRKRKTMRRKRASLKKKSRKNSKSRRTMKK